MMAARDRRKPLEMRPCIPSNRNLIYYRDFDGSARPKAPPTPPAEPVAVLRYLLDLDRLSRGRDGRPYNPRLLLDAGQRALIEAAIAGAGQ